MRHTKSVILWCVFVAWVAVTNAEVIRWVPAAAAVNGQFGTTWSTDLWVHNMATDQPITVYVSLHYSQDGLSATDEVAVEVPTTTPIQISDVVGSLLGQARAGALRLRSEHPFEARSRTFNDGGDVGSFGQGIPAVDPANALAFGALVGAANLPGANGIRSNLGIVNPGDELAHVLVFVMRSENNETAEFVSHFRLEVGPHGWVQGDLFALAGVEDMEIENAYAIVAGDTDPVAPDTPIFSYLSRIDNRSGDAIYIEPFLNLTYATEAPDATMRFSLESIGDFSPYLVSYPDSAGSQQTFLLPDPNWQTEVTLDANQIMCFQVMGHVPVDGEGSAEACLEFEVEEGGSGSSCRFWAGEPGDVCDLEICTFVY